MAATKKTSKAAKAPATVRKTATRAAAPTPAKAPETTPERAKAPKLADGTAVIRFEKEKSGRRGVVRGAVNGQKFEFPVGKDVTVTAAQLAVLRNSNETFTIVTPLAGVGGADEGSSASSTLEGTAIRAEPPVAENPGIDEDGEPHTPELSQRTDDQLASDSQQASQDQAEGDGGSAGDGGDTGTKPTGEMKPA